jgi:hypothetical protein
MVNVQHQERDGNIYANIEAVMAIRKGDKVPEPTHPALSFDIEKWDQGVYDSLSDGLKKVIDASEERKGKKLQAMNGVGGKDQSATATLDEDDSIPF